MKRTKKLPFIVSAIAILSAGSAPAVLTNYTWSGSADNNWMNAANWGATGIAPTGTVSETRLNVNNTTGSELVYSSALGTTVFAGLDNNPRSLVIGLGSSVTGQLRIAGGTLEGRGASSTQGAADLIGGNGGAGRLIIDGGTYLRTNDVTGTEQGAEMVIGFGTTAGTLGELIVSNGLASIRHIRLNNGNGTGVGGAIRLDGGTLEVHTVSSGGANGGHELYLNGGTMRAFAASPIWVSNNVNVWVENGGAVFDTAGFNAGITRDILQSGSSTGGLIKTGAGTLTLSGANTFVGRTVVNGGALAIGVDTALGAAPTAPTAGHLVLDGGILSAVNTMTLDANRGLSLGPAGSAGTGVISVNSGQALTYTGVVADNGPDADGLVKTSGGTLVLGGANTYGGTTTVSGGVLRVEHASALGTTAGGTVVINGARLELSGGVTVSGEALTISGNGGDAFGALRSSSGVNEWAGPVTLGANQARLGVNGGDLIVSGAIGDNGNNFGLLVRSPNGNLTNVVTLSGSNTYGGRTEIYQGFVKLDGGDNRLPVGTVLSLGFFNTGNPLVGQLDLNGYDQEIAGLEVGASVTDPLQIAGQLVTNSAAGVSRLTVNNGADYAYRGVLAGNLDIVKSGPGTLTLSGANTYSGSTTVSGGVLRVNGTQTGGGLITVLSGATLGGTGAVGAVAVGAGGRLAPGNSAGTLTVGGALTLDGLSILDFELDAPDPVGGVVGDYIAGIGGLTLDGQLNIASLGFDFATALAGDTWKLMSFNGALTDQALEIGTAPSLAAGLSYSIETTADSVFLAVIPEPATAGLMAAALAAWFLRRRRPL